MATFDHIKPDTARQLPTLPANLKKQFHRNEDWYAEVGAGGKSNLEMIIERWNRWTISSADRRTLVVSLGLVVGHSIGSIAYVMVIVSATLAGFDRSLERAAMSLGAGPLLTFRRVTFPLIRAGVISGAVFAFIHSFDEVVITMFISGVHVQTLPLKMWEDIRSQIDPTIAAVSSMLILLPVVWLVAPEVGRGLQRAKSGAGATGAV